jgi:hypothetical protein
MFGFDVSVQTLAGLLVAFLAGATAPTYYAQERLRGFGRAMFDRLPYRAPPGMDEEQALLAALESAEDEAQDTDQQTTKTVPKGGNNA